MSNKEILLKTTSTWDNKTFENISIQNPEVTVLKITFDVGESLPMHKHDILNIAYVKQGILTVTADTGEQITVKEGECLPEVIGTYHYGKNTGDKPVELIVFYLGEKGSDLSINKAT